MNSLKATKRPSLLDAISWIAYEDNPGDGDGVEEIAGYISTILVADLFGLDAKALARRVFLARAMGDVTEGRVTLSSSRCSSIDQHYEGTSKFRCVSRSVCMMNGEALCARHAYLRMGAEAAK
jgi:hypothetical protein